MDLDLKTRIILCLLVVASYLILAFLLLDLLKVQHRRWVRKQEELKQIKKRHVVSADGSYCYTCQKCVVDDPGCNSHTETKSARSSFG